MMQKSKRILTVFLIIIIVLIIISFVFISQANKSDRLLNICNKISSNDRFTFKMEAVSSEYNYEILIAQNGKEMAIDTKSGEEHTTTLLLDGEICVILHNMEEYYSIHGEDNEENFVISGLQEISEKQYTSGKEKIDGKTYYYEEYKNVSSFLMLLHDSDDSEITTKFYFDNNKLVYIKNTVIDEEEKDEELLKITIKYSIDEKLFEIPSDYAEL